MGRTKALAYVGITFLIAAQVSMVHAAGRGPTINDAASSFSNSVAAAKEILKAEVAAKVPVRRSEAIAYYIKNGDDSSNITRNGAAQSFANYVCTGTGALSRDLAALEFASRYGATATALTKPAGDKFAEQWARYKQLREEPKAPVLSPVTESATSRFDACSKEVVSLLEVKPKPATDTTDEIAFSAILAAVKAADALFDSAKVLGARILGVVNERKARERLKEFVIENDEKLTATLASDLNVAKLSDAWQRRKAMALAGPYQTFVTMIQINPAKDPAGIWSLSTQVNSQLQAYDAMRVTPGPERVVVAVVQAQKALKEAAEAQTDTALIVELLRSIAEDLEDWKKDYEDVIEKAEAAAKAVKQS